MSLKGGDVDRAWQKLGFSVNATGDIHAKLYVDGKLILRTKRSMGSGKLDGNIPHFIRQQMKLNEDQFARAVECPLTREEYLQILREKKVLDPLPKDNSSPP
jgi:hypothetical protein